MRSNNEDENALVLIVDDEIINLEVHKAMISNLKNMKCDTAMSGAEALSLISNRLQKIIQGRSTMYKIILMDYSMPDMNGPQTVKKIREILQSGTREMI